MLMPSKHFFGLEDVFKTSWRYALALIGLGFLKNIFTGGQFDSHGFSKNVFLEDNLTENN